MNRDKAIQMRSLPFVRQPGWLLALTTAAALLLALPVQAANFTVNVFDSSSDGECVTNCSLIDAINLANTNTEADVIDLGGNTITLTAENNNTDGANGLPSIVAGGGQLTIRNGTICRADSEGCIGPGNVNGGGSTTGAFRLVHVSATGALRLERLTLRGGEVVNGGGVFSRGTLTLDGCTVQDNVATGGSAGAGLLLRTGVTTIINSTISRNIVPAGFTGGAAGIAVNPFGASPAGRVFLISSTVTGNENSSGGRGGGLLAVNGGTITLRNSIVSGNTATAAGEIRDADGGGRIISQGGNLIGHSGTANTENFTPGATDIVPAGALNTILGPLDSNGGPTQTHALVLPNSPAIDFVPDSSCGQLTTDQRGLPRQGLACDSGAYESAPISVFVVNSLADPGVGTCDASECTLREAIAAANADADLSQINFQAGLSGTIALANGEMTISQPLAITGPGQLTVDGQNNSRIFNASAPLVLRQFTLTRGRVGNASQGGAVRATTHLTLSGVTISNSTAGISGQAGANQGGGVFMGGGHLIMADSTLSGNATLGVFGAGGGVHAANASTATMNRSLFLGNRADQSAGGSLLPAGSLGNNKTATLNDSAFVNNLSSKTGGAITLGSDLDATLTNITFAGNTAGIEGAAIDTSGRGSLSLRHTTIVGAGAKQLATSFAISAENSLISSGATPACNFGTSQPRNGTLTINGSNNQTTDASCVGPGIQSLAALNLGPLGYYGGPTPTVPLLRSGDSVGTGVNSVALDAALACVSGVVADQRGVSRPQGSACDIGAFEREATGSLAIDFGDAPDASVTTTNPKGYPVRIGDQGAGHLLGGPRLGTNAPDGDTDGQPSADASGDGADEDGLGAVSLVAGTTGSIAVTASGGFLSAWIDLNRDGDWDDAGEQIASDQAVATGTTTLSPAVPANASVGGSFLRLRLCSTAGQCNTPTGVAADGEVEDHAVTIVAPAPAVTLSATSLNFGSVVVGSSSAPQSVTVTNTGNATLNLGNIAPAGDISQFQLSGSNPCTDSMSLAPKASCTITGAFAPTSTGAKSASVTVASNAPNSPHSVTLTGTGVTGGSNGGGFPVTPGGTVPSNTDTSGTNSGSGSGSSGTTTTSSGSSGGCVMRAESDNSLQWLIALTALGFYSRRRRAGNFRLRIRHPINLIAAATLLLALPAQAATFNPTDAAGLIAAINTANTNSEADVIDLGGNTITLTAVNSNSDGNTGLPSVAAGGGQLIIRNGTIERSASAANFRLLHVSAAGNLSLQGLTLRGGSITGDGGAIANQGTLTLTQSTVSGNGTSAGNGGGLHNSGTATLNQSTVSGNNAHTGGGLANFSSSTLTLNNSTVSGNNASDVAGGLFNVGSLTLNHSTVSGNVASGGGGLFTLFSGSTTTLTRSIIAGNGGSTPNEVWRQGGTVTADAYNLFGHAGETDAQAFTNFAPGTSDIKATSTGSSVPLASIINTTLANNGGPTLTHALCEANGTPAGCTGTSPAINPATGAACLASPLFGLDQRGFLRDGNCDIGAYEALAIAASYDFGDAPSTYPVTLAQNGARHVRDVPESIGNPTSDVDSDGIADVLDNCRAISNATQVDSDNDGSGADCDSNDNNASVGGSGRRARPYLGSLYSDPESDGQSTASADGDDANGGAPDDEDGVTLPITLTAGTAGNIVVTTPRGAFLSAWIDYNRDGDWDDAGEQIANQFAAVPGPNTLTPAVPAAASAGTSFLRLRVCSNLGQCNTPTGLAADGEVEDHPVTITAPAVTLSATSLNFGSVVVGSSSAAQGITVTNTGTADLKMSSVATTGDTTQFQPVANNPCLSTTVLVPNASCTIAAIFAPTSTGAKSATVTVDSNAPNSPHSVTLTGTGVTGGSNGGGFPVTPGGTVSPSNDTTNTSSGSGSSGTTTTSSGSSGGCTVKVNGNNGLQWLLLAAGLGWCHRRRVRP